MYTYFTYEYNFNLFVFLCVCVCWWFLSPSHSEICAEWQTILFHASLHLLTNNSPYVLACRCVCVFVCSFAWVNCTILWRKRFTISCLHLFIASQQMAKMSQKMSSKKVAELVTGTFLEQNFHFVQKASLPIIACIIVFNLRFAISHFPIFILIAFSDSVDCLVANQFS